MSVAGPERSTWKALKELGESSEGAWRARDRLEVAG